MKRKTKTALELLEKEVTKLTDSEAMSATGGDSNDPSDCVYQAIAFATGKSMDEIRLSYGSYLNNIYSALGASGHSDAYWADLFYNGGVPINDVAWLAYSFGLTKVGDTPSGASGYSFAGDQSVAIIASTLYRTAHAVVLTGNADAYSYYFYDPQDGTTGTIPKDDPTLYATYGFD